MRDVNDLLRAGVLPHDPFEGASPVGGKGQRVQGIRALFEPLASFLDRAETMPEPTWIVPNLVPGCGRVLIVAAPNAGKTFLALVLAKTAASAGRPVYLVLEEGAAKATASRFKSLAFSPSLPVHIAHLRGVRLADAEFRSEVSKLLRGHAEPVLVLDPFAAVYGGDENDTVAMVQATRYLEELMRANERALLAVPHHTSKAGERGDGPAIHAGRGNSALVAWADVQLNLKHERVPKGSGRVAFVVEVAKMRDGERGEKQRVSVSLGDGTVAMEPVAQRDGGEGRERLSAEDVLEVIASEPRSENALAEALRVRREDVSALTRRLAGEGRIRRVGSGPKQRWETTGPFPGSGGNGKASRVDLLDHVPTLGVGTGQVRVGLPLRGESIDREVEP